MTATVHTAGGDDLEQTLAHGRRELEAAVFTAAAPRDAAGAEADALGIARPDSRIGDRLLADSADQPPAHEHPRLQDDAQIIADRAGREVELEAAVAGGRVDLERIVTRGHVLEAPAAVTIEPLVIGLEAAGAELGLDLEGRDRLVAALEHHGPRHGRDRIDDQLDLAADGDVVAHGLAALALLGSDDVEAVGEVADLEAAVAVGEHRPALVVAVAQTPTQGRALEALALALEADEGVVDRRAAVVDHAAADDAAVAVDDDLDLAALTLGDVDLGLATLDGPAAVEGDDFRAATRELDATKAYLPDYPAEQARADRISEKVVIGQLLATARKLEGEGNSSAAIAAYRDVLERDPTDADAREALARLIADETLEEPSGAVGSVVITSNPTADLYIDDTSYGTTPYSGQLPVGTHTLRMEARGYEIWQSTVEIKDDKNDPFRVSMKPRARGGGKVVRPKATGDGTASAGDTSPETPPDSGGSEPETKDGNSGGMFLPEKKDKGGGIFLPVGGK